MTCLQNAAFNESYGNSVLKKAYLTELLVLLNRAFLDSQDEDMELDVVYDEKISSVISFINENLQEDLSLESLANRFYTSKYHLLREFKKHTGYTIYQYIRKKRLITARMLLKDGLRVTEACQRMRFRRLFELHPLLQKGVRGPAGAL